MKKTYQVVETPIVEIPQCVLDLVERYQKLLLQCTEFLDFTKSRTRLDADLSPELLRLKRMLESRLKNEVKGLGLESLDDLLGQVRNMNRDREGVRKEES